MSFPRHTKIYQSDEPEGGRTNGSTSWATIVPMTFQPVIPSWVALQQARVRFAGRNKLLAQSCCCTLLSSETKSVPVFLVSTEGSTPLSVCPAFILHFSTCCGPTAACVHLKPTKAHPPDRT